MQITVDKFGRIIIPKKLRQRLGLKANDVLELTLVEDKLLLSPKREMASVQRKGRVLVVDSEATANLEQALEQLREDHLRQLSR